MKRTSFTWTLAVLIWTTACIPSDPSLDSKRAVATEDPVPSADAPVVATKEDAPTPISEAEELDEPPATPEILELPGLPYELTDLPADTVAPWPGGLVHGALVNVVEVTDGDTVKVQTADEVLTIRVLGINAPECDKRASTHGRACDPTEQDFAGEAEYYGVEAWAALRELIEGRDVRIACDDSSGRCEQDLYDRSLAFLVLEGLDVSEAMTAGGFALTYTQFPPANVYTYCVAEDAAMQAGLGIWSDGRDTAITRMNGDTRRWYAYHDSTCAEHAP